MWAIDTQLLHMRAKGSHAPFKTTVSLFSIFVLYKGLVLLIDRVIRQMCVFCLLTCQILILVLLRGESDKSFPEDVYSEGVVAGHDNVKSEVKLMALDQKRIVQVPWDHTSFSLHHISQFVHNVDASSAWGSRWLDDPVIESQRPVSRLDLAVAHQHLVFDHVFLVAEALAKLLPLLWKTESFRQKVKVLLRETFLHLYDIDG